MDDSLKPDLKDTFDYTTLWSKNARKPHHFNRMDPDPDSDSSLENAAPIVKRNRDGTIKKKLTKDDWQRFWAERLRKQVDAPGLSDRELYDIFCRDKSVYFKQKQERAKIKPPTDPDPDMPPSFYWNNKQILKWAEEEGFPALITEMLSSNEIRGKDLITLDARTLQKAGLYDLDVIKTVTQAVRKLLGLPATNSLRATGRPVPLEMFLRLKIRTGRLIELLTFQQFCENENIDYGPAKEQLVGIYRPIPPTCRVVIKPYKYEKVKWIPISPRPINTRNAHLYEDSDSHAVLSDSAGSSSSDNLGGVPTVEELADSVFLRSSLIQDILDDIIRAVYQKIAYNNKLHHDVADGTHKVIKTRLEEAFMDFNINSAEDKLKFVTVIAEELVDDVIRAREILNDMDKFHKKMQQEIPEAQMNDLQQAIAHYVQSIMPLVVSAALKEMEESTVDFQTMLNDAQLNETQVDETSSTVLIMKRFESAQESTSNLDLKFR